MIKETTKSCKHSQRTLINAVFYVIKTGCQWRFLPKEYPPWKTVYSFYKRAKDQRIWKKMMKDLVEKSRIKMGRDRDPSYCLIDSQSVKTTDKAAIVALMGKKRSKVERGIFSPIHKVIYFMSRSMLPIPMIRWQVVRSLKKLCKRIQTFKVCALMPGIERPLSSLSPTF